MPGAAAVEAGAHGLSLINTIKSIVGVDLDRMVPYPVVGSRSTNGGYCGPAVKPIALHMVAALARDPRITVPISGIGGIATWRDAAEFIALGATSVQVCTAVMHYGFRIVEDMIDGLSNFLDDKGMKSVNELRGRAIRRLQRVGRSRPQLQGRGARRRREVHRLRPLLRGLPRQRASTAFTPAATRCPRGIAPPPARRRSRAPPDRE